MNRKIKYDSIKWSSPELGQGIVKGYTGLVETLAAEIKGGHYVAYPVKTAQSLEEKRRATRRRNIRRFSMSRSSNVNKVLATNAGNGYG